MNDKQQLAAMGEHMREMEECERALLQKRVLHLEGLVEKLTNRPAWRNIGSPNGLRRFMTQKQYDVQTPGVQKWYEPIRYEVPYGWRLVPAKMTDAMENAIYKELSTGSLYGFKGAYSAMLAAAPEYKP